MGFYGLVLVCSDMFPIKEGLIAEALVCSDIFPSNEGLIAEASFQLQKPFF